MAVHAFNMRGSRVLFFFCRHSIDLWRDLDVSSSSSSSSSLGKEFCAIVSIVQIRSRKERAMILGRNQ